MKPLKRVILILNEFPIGTIEIDKLPSSSSEAAATTAIIHTKPNSNENHLGNYNNSRSKDQSQVLQVRAPPLLNQKFTFDDIENMDVDDDMDLLVDKWSSKDDDILYAAVTKIGLKDCAIWKKVSKSWFHGRKIDFECENRWNVLKLKKGLNDSMITMKQEEWKGRRGGGDGSCSTSKNNNGSSSMSSTNTIVSGNANGIASSNKEKEKQSKRKKVNESTKQASSLLYHHHPNHNATSSIISTSPMARKKNPSDVSNYYPIHTKTKYNSNTISSNIDRDNANYMNDNPVKTPPNDNNKSKHQKDEFCLSDFLSPPLKRPFPCL